MYYRELCYRCAVKLNWTCTICKESSLENGSVGAALASSSNRSAVEQTCDAVIGDEEENVVAIGSAAPLNPPTSDNDREKSVEEEEAAAPDIDRNEVGNSQKSEPMLPIIGDGERRTTTIGEEATSLVSAAALLPPSPENEEEQSSGDEEQQEVMMVVEHAASPSDDFDGVEKEEEAEEEHLMIITDGVSNDPVGIPEELEDIGGTTSASLSTFSSMIAARNSS